MDTKKQPMSFFKKSGRLPQIRTSPARRAYDAPTRSRSQTNRLGIYLSSQRNLNVVRPWLPISLVVGIVILLIAAPAWLPAMRLIIPDRYLLTYAPGPIQRLIFRVDPARIVPTPATNNQNAAFALIQTPTPDEPTATPAVANEVNTSLYVQPTAFAVAPTATFTPVYAQAAADGRAQDRQNAADLSRASRLLTGFKWIRQGANDCGPASITVLMSYWGVNFTQEDAIEALKPNPEDPNVRPDEIAAFVETKGYHAMVRINGNIDLLKQLILAGYPVLIETGYDPEPLVVGWTSHYLTLVGFSDADRQFIAMDTYRRPNWGYPYEEIDKYWRQFNRRYLVVYQPDQAAAVSSLIGADMNDATMYTSAMRTAQLELSVDRSDAFGWFNLGSSLTGLGRYQDAVSAFDQARRTGLPSRFLWYQFSIFDAYLQQGGEYTDQALFLANDVLASKASEEAFYYKGMAYLSKGDKESARQQFNLALRFNKHYEVAKQALAALGEAN